MEQRDVQLIAAATIFTAIASGDGSDEVPLISLARQAYKLLDALLQARDEREHPEVEVEVK